jgi:hypothetical protein
MKKITLTSKRSAGRTDRHKKCANVDATIRKKLLSRNRRRQRRDAPETNCRKSRVSKCSTHDFGIFARRRLLAATALYAVSGLAHEQSRAQALAGLATIAEQSAKRA